jgi:hypothetical protein
VVVGGAITGSGLYVLAGLVQELRADLRLAPFLVGCALLSLVGRGTRRALPEITKMIPQTRFHRGLLRGIHIFGIELGLGFRTRIPTAGPYLLAATVVFYSTSFRDVAAAAAGWGLGRGLPLYLRLLARDAQRDSVSIHRALTDFDAKLTSVTPAVALTVLPVAVVTGVLIAMS